MIVRQSRQPVIKCEERQPPAGEDEQEHVPDHAQTTMPPGRNERAPERPQRRDVRTVAKDGDGYSVEVNAEANVLLRIEKTLKSNVQPDWAAASTTRASAGRGAAPRSVCIPVNCRTSGLQSYGEE
jgi:hypothetical protein